MSPEIKFNKKNGNRGASSEFTFGGVVTFQKTDAAAALSRANRERVVACPAPGAAVVTLNIQ